MVNPTFTPRIYRNLIQGNPLGTFSNSFVPNPLCCPSRASTLTGTYSHTNGVWSNKLPYGGFPVFNDESTIALDFQEQGYRTGLIGKYLNGYDAGRNTYVPPGWGRWFAANTGAYYRYRITTQRRLLHFGHDPSDYITRVLEKQAERFVDHSVSTDRPFLLYYAFTAPHAPAKPDPRDIGRFSWVTPDDTGTPEVHQNMLEAAFGVDRAVGALLRHLPENTIVVYMSDNGLQWGERKGDRPSVRGKYWPYNEAIRVPIIIQGAPSLAAQFDDLVLNVDLRQTLTAMAGIVPIIPTGSPAPEGLDWSSPDYSARLSFPLEHWGDVGFYVPTYCGEREKGFMYVRWQDGSEELYAAGDETTNVVGDEAYAADYQRLRRESHQDCSPPPPGYSWDVP